MDQSQNHKIPQPPSITLRKFTESDVDAFMSWAADPRVTRFQRRAPYTRLMPWRTSPLMYCLTHGTVLSALITRRSAQSRYSV
jgi:RimJ/RimL family protein N-acetyltransferase